MNFEQIFDLGLRNIEEMNSIEFEKGCAALETELGYDEACVELTTTSLIQNLWLYVRSSDCHNCPYERFSDISNSSVKVSTARRQFWKILKIPESPQPPYVPPLWSPDGSQSVNSSTVCRITPDLGQWGTYELMVHDDDAYEQCVFRQHKEPTNPYTPLAIVFAAAILVLFLLSGIKQLTNYCRKRKNRQNQKISEDPVVQQSQVQENDVAHEQKLRSRRVHSLDVVRGISILMMIFVNDGAAGYPILKHATWNGLAFGDLVFPCFMWIMGVCIPLSVSGQFSRGISKFNVCWPIVKRSFFLFLIGVGLNTLGGDTRLEKIRIFGVLQRLAVSYLIVAMVYALLTNKKKLEKAKNRACHEILTLAPQWVISLLILGTHIGITFLLKWDGCPNGYLGPGGLHANGRYRNCSGGAAGYVDRLLLGEDHIFHHPTADGVYRSGSFDPEGILGCLTSIFQVFLGVQAGQILLIYKDWKNRLIRWLLWAMGLGLLGAALHFTGTVPVNKNLWSVSFVFITTCFCLGLLSVCYFFVDLLKIWEGGPFRIPGMNALTMYVGHELCYQIFPFHWTFGDMNTHEWLLAESMWNVVLWICLAYVLHRKKIYVSL